MRLYEKFACILIILSLCNSGFLASEEQGKYIVIVSRAGSGHWTGWHFPIQILAELDAKPSKDFLLLLLIATRIFRASGLKSQNPVGKVAILFKFSSPIDFSCFFIQILLREHT